ncbi:MAG: GNAT family N-acetyltransferase [Telmatospirillum sp.]|nr:GNAT family N-acetyltransferase [Telmatospirillum sp.]
MIRLRPATPADVEILERWDAAPHVVASDPDEDDWDRDREIRAAPDWREQLIATLHGRPIGCVQIIDPAREEHRYWGDCAADLAAVDIWIGEADCLGKGYGTEMMRQALARCFADVRVAAVVIDPLADNVRAHRFYERLGFRFVERRRFGAHDCPVYRLGRGDWSLARAGS